MEVALEEKEEEEEEEEKKNRAVEEKQEEEEGLFWAEKRTDEERRKDINGKKLKKDWERNSKQAPQRETERQLWREHLQRLGESPSSSHSSEKDEERGGFQKAKDGSGKCAEVYEEDVSEGRRLQHTERSEQSYQPAPDSAMKKLSQEREKMEKEMLEKLLEKRRKAKEAP
ncbi:hypothetical protein NFI96_024760 [Prochilodus magdalenae]|nr:hypothetical protein NFI96_024760 [Prochilodus magdalenae]